MTDDKPRRNPRVPPHNMEAEYSVLGGALLSKQAFFRVVEVVRPEHFYKEAHRLIYEAMLEIYNRNEPIDEITLCAELTSKGVLSQIGGQAYVASLTDYVPTPANISYYAAIVRDKSVARRLISVGADLTTMAMDESNTRDYLLGEAERMVFEISQQSRSEDFYPIREIIKENFQTIDRLFQAQEPVSGVPSGFTDLDRLTTGFQSSTMIIVAGRPAMGKTAFALNMAQHAALTANMGIALFSLEMAKEELVMRMLCSQARIDMHRIKEGKINQQDWKDLAAAAGVLGDAPIYINDKADIDLYEMRSQCRRLKLDKDIRLVVIDYLQLMKGHGRAESREREISEISRGLKMMSKELQIPIMAISQLNRGVESRTDKKPMLSDLRESGALEQDADMIMFVHRPEYYNPDDESLRGKAEIILGKHRSGPTGTVEVAFIREYVRFDNLAKDGY